jgi:pyruvate dehydrogenase E2 component (dihydrolipoamide acetyltransferase)
MLGVTVEKGIIIEWLKAEGDPVEKGESIFVVEAEKVTTEVESPASGILAKILLPVGKEVPVLTVAAVITVLGEAVPPKYLTPGDQKDLAPEPIAAEVSPQTPRSTPAATVAAGEPIRIVPAARKRAQDTGLALETIAGTGPDGVILFSDVETALKAPTEPASKVSTLARRYAEQKKVSLAELKGTGVRGRIMRADIEQAVKDAQTPALGKTIPMGSMRQTIARRVSESAYSAPHISLFTDICLDPLHAFRQEILADFEAKFGLRLSINDLLIKAVALNILDFPILNAIVGEKEIHIPPEINIGLAVALPDGLIVPSVLNADKAGLADIARQRMDLVRRARAGNLAIEEIERGTFTISSLANYDIIQFTAILNPPQSGILSVGKIREELFLNNGEVSSRKVGCFGLSVDHRIIDGATAAQFLQQLKWKLEKPTFTFLSL